MNNWESIYTSEVQAVLGQLQKELQHYCVQSQPSKISLQMALSAKLKLPELNYDLFNSNGGLISNDEESQGENQ